MVRTWYEYGMNEVSRKQQAEIKESTFLYRKILAETLLDNLDGL